MLGGAQKKTRRSGATGGCWSEALIGTAIASRGPVQIYAAEHFCVDVKRWTCAAAPILNGSGRVRGVVDVSGVKETFHGHTLGLVMAAARQIETDFSRRDDVLNSRLLAAAMTSFARYGSDCLLLADHRGRILRVAGDLGAMRARYHLPDRLDIGSVLASLELPRDVQRQAILAAVANARGNMSLAARTLGISRSTLYVKIASIRSAGDAVPR